VQYYLKTFPVYTLSTTVHIPMITMDYHLPGPFSEVLLFTVFSFIAKQIKTFSKQVVCCCHHLLRVLQHSQHRVQPDVDHLNHAMQQ